MPMFYSPPQTVREREYLYIDGGCLRATVKSMSKELFGDENCYQPLVKALAIGGYDKIFYYDAVPGRDYGENEAAYELRVQPDHERFAKIQALDRVHVALGRLQGPNKRQKGVDVRLAVDMMTHAFRGHVSKATLFAGDSDFVPLIKALVGEGMHVTLWHPPQANAELKGAADTTRLFNFKADYGAFSQDGAEAAFKNGNNTYGAMPPNGPRAEDWMRVGDVFFAGTWSNSELNIWRSEDTESWSSISLFVPGADLTRATAAFELIYGWGIFPDGEKSIVCA